MLSHWEELVTPCGTREKPVKVAAILGYPEPVTPAAPAAPARGPTLEEGSTLHLKP